MATHTQTEINTSKLIENMTAFADRGHAQVPGMLQVIKLLSYGQPLSRAKVAKELELDSVQVDRLWRIGEVNEKGDLVGFGISLVPTPHRYQIEDRGLYVWCAADAIMFSMFLKMRAFIQSPDPISGERINLVVSPNGVESLDPKTTVISHPTETEGLKNVRRWFCDATHFFASHETADEYVANRQEIQLTTLSAQEVFEIWQKVYDREPYVSLVANR